MHDWTDLFPRKWIIGAVVVLLVLAPATWAILTFTEADPPPPELVAEVQGLPPSGGSRPCLNLVLAEAVAANPAFSQEFRANVFEETGQSFDEAASVISDAATVENFEAISEAFDSSTIKEATNSTLPLDQVLAEEITVPPGVDRADLVTDVFGDC